MRLVFGIGNPGPKYDHTRHNLGFAVIHAIAAEASARIVPIRELRAEGARVRLGGEEVDDPGAPAAGDLAEARRRLGLRAADLLVVTDDLNLPPGRLRLRGGGSDGGHNGLRSILAHLATPDFPRLRIGIGMPPPRVRAEDYVLGRFPEEQFETMRAALSAAVDAVRLWIGDGLERAMSSVNRRDLDPGTNRP